MLITGAFGLLGAHLTEALGACHELVLTDVVGDAYPLDVTDAHAVRRLLANARPELVVHAAAYTDVDACERDRYRAFKVNAIGTWNVAMACRDAGSAMLYVSTDYVFGGEKGEPYTEYDAPNPLSAYGASKLAGEQYVRALVNEHYIVRTAWLYGEKGKCFPKTILQLSDARKEIAVVSDQVGSPTYARDLAEAIRELIGSPLYGTYHITNEGACSWYDLANAVFALAGREDVTVKPISTTEWAAPAQRPRNSALRNYSLELQGHDKLRLWRKALADFVSRLDI